MKVSTLQKILEKFDGDDQVLISTYSEAEDAQIYESVSDYEPAIKTGRIVQFVVGLNKEDKISGSNAIVLS